MLDIFAKIENNNSRLDLNFRIQQNIAATVEKVFRAVVQSSQIQKYFHVKQTGDFIEGTDVGWKFEGYDLFTLNVQQVVEKRNDQVPMGRFPC